MFRKKNRNGKKSAKPIVLAVSLVLLLALGIGGTVAYLVDRTDPVTNKFEPAQVKTSVVEKLENGVKSDVKIKNTGNTTAWIRAAIVVTWQDDKGNVYGGATPKLNDDYTLTLNLTVDGWVLGNDGFYYYKKPVEAEAVTEALINSCTYLKNAPEGYTLCVEILSSGIQHKPANVFNENWASSGLEVSTDGESLVEKKGGNS